jgi:hypothetical protein
MRRVHFKYVGRGMLTSLEGVFKEAAAFASKIAPEQLITIDVLHDGSSVVWYWASDEEQQALKEPTSEG